LIFLIFFFFPSTFVRIASFSSLLYGSLSIANIPPTTKNNNQRKKKQKPRPSHAAEAGDADPSTTVLMTLIPPPPPPRQGDGDGASSDSDEDGNNGPDKQDLAPGETPATPGAVHPLDAVETAHQLATSGDADGLANVLLPVCGRGHALAALRVAHHGLWLAGGRH
jgi:hypothetical protein